jgi:hypothetical protein
VDTVLLEFLGVAMVALCVIVLAVPCGRRPTGRTHHYSRHN